MNLHLRMALCFLFLIAFAPVARAQQEREADAGRRKAVVELGVRRGDRVLEIGCGTGRNFPYLREAIGAAGRLYGVDISPGMLRIAQRQCDDNGWTNIDLNERDAADYAAPEPLESARR